MKSILALVLLLHHHQPATQDRHSRDEHRLCRPPRHHRAARRRPPLGTFGLVVSHLVARSGSSGSSPSPPGAPASTMHVLLDLSNPIELVPSRQASWCALLPPPPLDVRQPGSRG